MYFSKWFFIGSAIVIASALCASSFEIESTETIYATGFEVEQGFDAETLVGQGGWQGTTDLGNGFVNDFFEGEGQQAFIGFSAEDVEEVILFRLLNVREFPEELPLIRFRVQMEIVDSTNRSRDNFSWSIFNLEEKHLFSLDFDNETGDISYLLDDDEGLISTGFVFENSVIYDLEIIMDFPRNSWCAAINGELIVGSLPITTQNAQRTLSDISAIWWIFSPQNPGDNYMLFDNYSVERARRSAIPPKVLARGILPNGAFVLRVLGEPSRDYRIEASSDFKLWTPIRSGKTAADGSFDFIDESAGNFAARFYRAILL